MRKEGVGDERPLAERRGAANRPPPRPPAADRGGAPHAPRRHEGGAPLARDARVRPGDVLPGRGDDRPAPGGAGLADARLVPARRRRADGRGGGGLHEERPAGRATDPGSPGGVLAVWLASKPPGRRVFDPLPEKTGLML